MQPRITMKSGDEIIMQVLCRGNISDGDLAALLEDAEQDLRWNVLKMIETHYTKPIVQEILT